MKRWVLALIVLALIIVIGAGLYWLGSDPGLLTVRWRGWAVETTVVFAVAAVLVVWILVAIAWRIVRWPLRAWTRAVRARADAHLASGLSALAEGRYRHAERDLDKASRHAAVRTPALIALAQAAHAGGAGSRAEQALGEVEASTAPGALAMRANFLCDDGHSAEALTLLKPGAEAGTLTPRGWQTLIDAALSEGDIATARAALAPLARSQALPADVLARLESRVYRAALPNAADTGELDGLWRELDRAQQSDPALVEAFARRATALGRTLAAMDAIESALRQQWSSALVRCYGELGATDVASRLRTASGWLAQYPDDPALLTTLGRLHVAQREFESGGDLLERALARCAEPSTWEALGDCRRGEGDPAGAATCYLNALRLARGEATLELPPGPESSSVRSAIAEERSELGVPRLPGVR